MPVREVRRNGVLVGYRWGNSGKLYRIAEYGKDGAYRKALEQGRAIHARRGREE